MNIKASISKAQLLKAAREVANITATILVDSLLDGLMKDKKFHAG